MSIMRWIERVLGRSGAAPACDAEQVINLLPLLNFSGTHMVVKFPRERRAAAVAYFREIALFRAALHAAANGERRN